MSEIDTEIEPRPNKQPVAGMFAVGFGVLGIFTHGYVFVPLALIMSIIAIFARQAIWAVVGLLLAVVGFLTSPILIAFLGLGALAIM